MPNWCENDLRITGPPEAVDRFLREARGRPPQYGPDEDRPATPPEEERLCFHRLYPVPDELLHRTYGAEAAAEKALPPVDGCPNGYEWENEHWGCKWGACDLHCRVTIVPHDDAEVVYGFMTAWSPPIGLLRHVSPRFPRLRFDLTYAEPGIGFQGRFIVRGGKVKLDLQEDWKEVETPPRGAGGHRDAAPGVILSVRGGVADVIFKPKGIHVTVLDYDTDGAEEDDPAVTLDPDGRACRILEWSAPEKVAQHRNWPMVRRAEREDRSLTSRRWRCPGCGRVVDYAYERLAEAGSPCCPDCDRDMHLVRPQEDAGPTR